MPPINVSGFEVKETPYREYGGTQDFVNAQLQNRRYEYQKQKDQEANLYRDLDIIGEGTSLKGKLTGVPEINRVYEKLTEGVLNDLVSKAGKIPVTELYGEMTKKMTPIFQGLEAATNDVKLGTDLANNITTQVKQLDKGALMSDITDRVKSNYLNPDGTHKDVNTVRPTDYSDIVNPNYLTKYATGTDALTNAFSADKGTDLDWKIKHPNGGEQTFRAKVPEYMQPSVSPEELMKNNLFVPKGQTMGFQIKGDEENGVKLFDKGLMNKYLNDLPTQIAFNKAFKEAHPEDLSRLTPIQLENLQRAFLADYAKKGFSIHDAGTYHPPRYSSTTNVYGQQEANLNNIYQRIKEKGQQRFEDYRKGDYNDNSLEAADLNNDELEVVLKATQDKDLKPEDIKVIVEDDGRIGVYNKGDGRRLVYLNQTGTNLPKQANTKGKAASVQKGNENYKPVTNQTPTKKKDPLGLFN